MNKLEQAARQAIHKINQVTALDEESDELLMEALTAMREALAEPELNLNCKSVQARLATSWGYVKAEQAEQEPVAWLVQYKDCHTFVWGRKPEFIVDGVVEPLYASPVRTKDITDDEIADIRTSIIAYEPVEWGRVFARAAIAADREKNNV